MVDESTLHYDKVVDGPPPIFMGPLPRSWSMVPAPVVVNMCGVFPYGPPPNHTVFCIALHDVQDPSSLPARVEFEAFLDGIQARARAEGSYWHCHAGLNRSGLALAAYLHRFHDMRISEAITLLRERRSPLVLCNSEFERALRRWYGDADEQVFEPVDIDAWLGARTGGREDWR